jgi:lipopolysaccharide export system protein LptA
MKLFLASTLALALLASTFAASAKTSDRNQEMTIDAGAQIGVITGDGVTTLSKGVVITQGTLEIRADSADIHMKGGEAVRAVFTGKQATMKQQLDDGSWMNARADTIDYNITTETIVLTGNYRVESPQGVNTGGTMTYNTRTGQMNSGGDGQRVRTVIPPKNKGTPPAAATPAAKTTVPTAGSKK